MGFPLISKSMTLNDLEWHSDCRVPTPAIYAVAELLVSFLDQRK